MNVYVMIEPLFLRSCWCELGMNGINEEARKRKYKVIVLDADHFSDEAQRIEPDLRQVILLGTSITWIPKMLRVLEKRGLQAILVNYDTFDQQTQHSIVRMDYVSALLTLMNSHLRNQHKHMALFGINPNSSADRIKEECFLSELSLIGVQNPKQHVYRNYADIASCCTDFLQNIASYDAIICANDLIGVYMITRLKNAGIQIPEQVHVSSFGESVLAQKISPSLTTVRIDYRKMGRQAVSLYAYINKQEMPVAVSVQIKAELVARESTQNDLFLEDVIPTHERAAMQVDFYNDKDIEQIMRVNALYSTMDDLDAQILTLLSAKHPIEKLVERCNTSTSTIGYRLREMRSILGVNTTEELLRLIGSYIRFE